MSQIRSLVLTALLLSTALPAQAAVFSVGGNFGVSYVTDGDGLLSIAAPGNSDPFFGGLMPGLRLGLNDQRFENLFALDLGLVYLNSGGSSIHVIELMGSFQHHFSEGSSSPFINLGGGLVTVGGDSSSETRALIGAGVGVRQTLVHGHGAGRFEVRLDHLTAADEFDTSLNVLSLRLGFDLYGR